MGSRNLEFAATLQINSRARAFANKASSSTEDAVRKVLRRAEKLAKENVAKGKGPSPHTGNDIEGHNYPYRDTGDLARSVRSAVWLQGFLTEGSIFTDLDYGVYLEVGWRTKAGNFFRYPWMRPAMMEALKLLPKFAAESFRTQMNDLDEDKVTDGAALESWAGAAQRWADNMKAMRGKTGSPEISGSEVQKSRRPRIQIRASKKPHGRPKDPVELGEDLPSERSRRQQKRRVENVEKFDTKLARKSKRSGEHERRSHISTEEAQQRAARTKKERELRDLREIADRNARKREAEQRRIEKVVHETQEELKQANAKLREQMKIKPPKIGKKTKKKKDGAN